MKIFYQGYPGAYGHKASIETIKKYNLKEENINGVGSFSKVFEEINNGNIGVLPMENSYAGSIHENYYNILLGDYVILDEIYLDINHFLLANNNDISQIKEVYSHPQALMQTQEYCKKNGFIQKAFSDTAGAAKFVKEKNKKYIASVSSELSAKIYGLNIVEKNIEDQNGNMTRFIIIVSKKIFLKNKKTFLKNNPKKMSVLFKTKDIPAALYKCLGAFATRFINLTKIESIPAKNDKFEYFFWIDFELNVDKKIIDDALLELSFFSKDLKILGKY